MKCFFDIDKVCPIIESGYALSGNYCLACTIREVGKIGAEAMMEKAKTDGLVDFYKNSDKNPRPEVG